MSQPAIQVENLSKLFYIGHQQGRAMSARQVLGNLLVRPVRRTFQLLTGHAAAASDLDEPLWALEDVSFTVNHGEVLGIIGRNGAGKSTLLKILSRITEPTSGRAVVHGRMGSLLEVGTGFHPDLTGRENVFLNGAMLGMSRAEVARKFDEIVEFAEIGKFVDTPVKHYSSGMYTRLAFAVAAHLEPEILVIDEVLAVGDAAFQQKCVGKMSEVAQHGRTVLFVSHNMAAVERLCTKAILLENGRLVEHGDTEMVLGRYLRSAEARDGVWNREAPWPADAHFRRAWLVDAAGAPCASPDSSGQFGVTVEFCLPCRRRGLLLAVGVDNAMQNPVFATSPQDDGVAVPEAPGLYRTTVLFPRGLLMPKPYLIRLALYDSVQLYDAQLNAIRFQVVERASLANATVGGRVGDVQVAGAWRPVVAVAAAEPDAPAEMPVAARPNGPRKE